MIYWNCQPWLWGSPSLEQQKTMNVLKTTAGLKNMKDGSDKILLPVKLEVEDVNIKFISDGLVLTDMAVFHNSPNQEERKDKSMPTLLHGSLYTVLLAHAHKLCDEKVLGQLGQLGLLC